MVIPINGEFALLVVKRQQAMRNFILLIGKIGIRYINGNIVLQLVLAGFQEQRFGLWIGKIGSILAFCQIRF